MSQQFTFDPTWYPLSTAPTDGTILQGLDAGGTVILVRCHKGHWTTTTQKPFTPTGWRYTRKDQWLRWKQTCASTKQPISTAPLDGTIIMGYWGDAPDPRPQEVRYYGQWFVLLQRIDNSTMWRECTPPTHWSPIN